jgi:hypothetical protein
MVSSENGEINGILNISLLVEKARCYSTGNDFFPYLHPLPRFFVSFISFVPLSPLEVLLKAAK